MAIKSKYFIGRGELSVKVDGEDTFLPLFNVSVAKVTQSETEITLKDYTDANGGDADSTSFVDSVSIELTAHSFNKENMAFFLRGDASALNEETVTDVPAVARIGRLIRIGRAFTNLVVKKGATVLVEGVDYQVKKGGFICLDSATITEADPITYSATLKATDVIAALTQAQKEMYVGIDGLNAADGKAVTVDLFRVVFGFADTLDFIGNEYGSVTIKGKVLKDGTGQGTSAFYDIKQEQ